MADKKVVEEIAKELPDMNTVKLRMSGLHLCANGVFSNVYRGTLLQPNGNKEIAIKKTWPERHERNFELVFLTGIGREKHKNIVHMLYGFSHRLKDDKICESFVFEFMPDTLASVVKRGVLDQTDIKLYTWQLFNGLKFLAEEHIVHRDIKPVNTLVDHGSGNLKIGDFGSSKVVIAGMKSTAYQVTRFYRPPELLLGSTVYSWTIDLWSAGTVVGEMLKRQVIFPGRETRHQMKLIFTTLGTPNDEDLKAMKSPTRFEGDEKGGEGLAALIPGAPADAIAFLERVLVYKPKERLSGKECLKHPYFESILKEGAKRSNGQLISQIITPADIEKAHEDRKGDGGKKLLLLMNRKYDFNCGVDSAEVTKKFDRRQAPSSSDSNEEIPKARKKASIDRPKKLLEMRSSSQENVSRETIKRNSREELSREMPKSRMPKSSCK